MNLVTPDFGLIFWTSIVFIILLLILKKFAWKPIIENVDARNTKIKNALISAEEAEKKMISLHAKNDEIIKKTLLERDNLIKEAKEISNKIISDAKNEGNKKKEQIIKNANEKIKNDEAALKADFNNQVGMLSIEISKKILSKELTDENTHQDLIADMIKNMKMQ